MEQTFRFVGKCTLCVTHILLFANGSIALTCKNSSFNGQSCSKATASSSTSSTCQSNLENCSDCGGTWVLETNCPAAEADGPIKLGITTDNSNAIIQLPVFDQPNAICMLWRVRDGRRQPAARSYGGYPWEASAVPAFGYTQFVCVGTSCRANLPPLENDGDYYELLTLERPPLPPRDEWARFLEQATFGPRPVDLGLAKDGGDPNWQASLNFAGWIQHQINDVPMTSHRRFFREHVRQRALEPSPLGVPTTPCQAGTHYRRYTFSSMDEGRTLEIRTETTVVNGSTTTYKILSIDGQNRTILPVGNLYASPQNQGVVLSDGL